MRITLGNWVIYEILPWQKNSRGISRAVFKRVVSFVWNCFLFSLSEEEPKLRFDGIRFRSICEYQFFFFFFFFLFFTEERNITLLFHGTGFFASPFDDESHGFASTVLDIKSISLF